MVQPSMGKKKNIHGKPFVVMLYKPSICLREKMSMFRHFSGCNDGLSSHQLDFGQKIEGLTKWAKHTEPVSHHIFLVTC